MIWMNAHAQNAHVTTRAGALCDVGPAQVAVRALRERPVLFKYCAEEVATARHNALFQRFITALTRGGPGGMPRPIELHAHDPKRYINDMLAWVHQSLAGEREFVVALFGDDKAEEREDSADTSAGDELGRHTACKPAPHVFSCHSPASPLSNIVFVMVLTIACSLRCSPSEHAVLWCHLWALASVDGGDLGAPDSLSTSALLDRIFESICRPLKVRIEQVLMTSPPLLLCFQLAQLHSFYLGLIGRAVGPGAQLTQVGSRCLYTPYVGIVSV